jgi:hypothetical protein
MARPNGWAQRCRYREEASCTAYGSPPDRHGAIGRDQCTDQSAAGLGWQGRDIKQPLLFDDTMAQCRKTIIRQRGDPSSGRPLMDISPEIALAKEELERPLLAAGLITGIDFGSRDEEAPDPDDLALRVFVADGANIPSEVLVALESFPFPTVVLQRIFMATGAGLPDMSRHRPIVGGASVAASRFFQASRLVHAGTLGAIVTDSNDPTIQYGLSNYHVLCVDDGRQVGDEIVQPEPGVLGILPGDRIGTLVRWSFPETTPEGPVDAAICTLEQLALPEVADVGPVFGTVEATVGMLVSKRGRTTGRTFGIVTTSAASGKYKVEFPELPPVGNPPNKSRILTNQIQVKIDFPQTITFGAEGDSGSVVLGGEFNRVVGLFWAAGSEATGDPLRYGVVTPAAVVETALQIKF